MVRDKTLPGAVMMSEPWSEGGGGGKVGEQMGEDQFFMNAKNADPCIRFAQVETVRVPQEAQERERERSAITLKCTSAWGPVRWWFRLDRPPLFCFTYLRYPRILDTR